MEICVLWMCPMDDFPTSHIRAAHLPRTAILRWHIFTAHLTRTATCGYYSLVPVQTIYHNSTFPALRSMYQNTVLRFNDAYLPSDICEGLHGARHVFLRVRSAQLHAHARCALRHHRNNNYHLLSILEASSTASGASPTMTGQMGWSSPATVRPADFRPSRKARVFSRRR
ncbi:hypothetical protein SFRURICE_000680 [Spodoptera frugiperda]|uniref:SFRICE_020083 n=1 Tax=Spodoptera frugiperda TaxID=7108 RepID=A0A2H1WSY8_SPOFR|nr:hypothetical protein SFRURICE_000680 [Spodoptera frugiperda]